MRQNWLMFSHIPGIFNVAVDKCSRESSLRTERKLNELIFKEVIYHFSYIPNVDLLLQDLSIKQILLCHTYLTPKHLLLMPLC